jgi:hypothetical protein
MCPDSTTCHHNSCGRLAYVVCQTATSDHKQFTTSQFAYHGPHRHFDNAMHGESQSESVHCLPDVTGRLTAAAAQLPYCHSRRQRLDNCQRFPMHNQSWRGSCLSPPSCKHHVTSTTLQLCTHTSIHQQVSAPSSAAANPLSWNSYDTPAKQLFCLTHMAAAGLEAACVYSLSGLQQTGDTNSRHQTTKQRTVSTAERSYSAQHMDHLDHRDHGCWVLAESALLKDMISTHTSRLLIDAGCEHHTESIDQWRRLLTIWAAYTCWECCALASTTHSCRWRNTHTPFSRHPYKECILNHTLRPTCWNADHQLVAICCVFSRP